MSGYFKKCAVISIWTVIQTLFHLSWTMYAYFMIDCYKPTTDVLVQLYITYFYQDKCGDIILERENGWISVDAFFIDRNHNTRSLFSILQEILTKGNFPKESDLAHRTQYYIKVFIICDFLWIISSILLLLGAGYRIKKNSSLYFYIPWLVMTATVVLLDTVAAVHFGFDIRSTTDFTSWLRLIGVANYNDFSHLNDVEDVDLIIASSPSILLSALSCRILIFWFSNVIAFFFVFNACIVAFQNNSLTGNNRRSQNRSSSDIILNSPSARIRNWQLFYGVGTTNSTVSSRSNNDIDYNSNSRISTGSNNIEQIQLDTVAETTNSVLRKGRLDSVPKLNDVTSSGRYYAAYPDPAEAVSAGNSSHMKTLRYQMPWSYFPQQQNYIPRKVGVPWPEYKSVKNRRTESATEF